MFDGLFEGWHPIVLLLITLVLFGPGKIPEVLGQVGRGVREFRTELDARSDARPATDDQT